jgi:hypothetical protein
MQQPPTYEYTHQHLQSTHLLVGKIINPQETTPLALVVFLIPLGVIVSMAAATVATVNDAVVILALEEASTDSGNDFHIPFPSYCPSNARPFHSHYHYGWCY